MVHTITVKAVVLIPHTPNFLFQPDGGKLPIEAVADEGLREIGRKYTDDLIEQAQKKRAMKNKGGGQAEEGDSPEA